MSLYEFEKQDPKYANKWKDGNVQEYKEAVFDRISQLLIENFAMLKTFLVVTKSRYSNVSDVQGGVGEEEEVIDESSASTLPSFTPAQINLYDLNQDGTLTQEDVDYARSVGANSIAIAIENLLAGQEANLDFSGALEDYQYHEQLKMNVLKYLQKTIRNQEIQVGIQNENEPIVLYQNDIDANKEDEHVIEAIFKHFNFTNPEYIGLKIDTTAADNDGITTYVNLILTHPDGDLNFYKLTGISGLEDSKIKDNLSQFIEILELKTNINMNSLLEYEETTFTEIKPKTE